jgi:hypothetical protein
MYDRADSGARDGAITGAGFAGPGGEIMICGWSIR